MIIYEYGSPGGVRASPRIPLHLEARIGPPSSATRLADAPPAEACATEFCFDGADRLPSLSRRSH